MAIRIHKVYTRSGDRGSTRLAGGQEVSKSDPRVQAYGVTDELGAHIGYLRSLIQGSQLEPMARQLERIQQELFDLGAVLATDVVDRTEGRADIPARYIARLEQELDAWNEHLPELRSFILAGGGVAASYAHVCRTVCRSAERVMVDVAQSGEIGSAHVAPNCLVYINRLSDYLFVAARAIARLENQPETLWDPARTQDNPATGGQ